MKEEEKKKVFSRKVLRECDKRELKKQRKTFAKFEKAMESSA